MGRPRLERAGPDDVLNLAVDRGPVPMHIAALLVLDGAAGAEQLRAVVAGRAAAVPRLATRLRGTPPGAGRPVWLPVDAAHVDRRVGVRVLDRAGPLGEDTLLGATAGLVLTPLDRSEPLWRAEVLADDDDHALALVVVAHHALADGIGGLAVLGALADHPAGPGAGVGPPALVPRLSARDPGVGALYADAWLERVRAVRTFPARWARARHGARSLAGGRGTRAQSCSLLAPGTAGRRLDVARCALGPLVDAAHHRGATLNDLVVASVVEALAQLLRRRGERVDELVVSVPVSARRGAGDDLPGNAVGAVPVRVPVGVTPDQRLAALVAQRDRLRGRSPGSSAALLTPLFRGLAAVGLFQLFVDHQRLVHTFVTNVRGPDRPLAVDGSLVREVVPVATNPGDVTASFDVLSYDGRVVVTVVSDPVHLPEGTWLAERLEHALAAWVAEPPRG